MGIQLGNLRLQQRIANDESKSDMKNGYMILGTLLIAAWAWAEFTGWELAPNTKRGNVPASARNTGGFRSYHFWAGGK